MRATRSTRPRNAGHPSSQAATGVPPVPPEDSPKADPSRFGRPGSTSTGPKDVRQVITDRIIGMLERGGNVFRERWTRAASRGVPRNGRTGASYHGANVLLLWDAAIEHGYASNVWMTYKQAASIGAQVRKGERAVLCAHFERKALKGQEDVGGERRRGEEDENDGDAGRRGVLLCKPFWLFNVAQIDGLKADVASPSVDLPKSPHGPVEGAMRLLGGCDARIRYGYERAMYVPGLDEIRLPWPRQFTSAEAHCATALHELVHWTGHPGRLGRSFGKRFGDAAYAFEELVAELGAAFAMGYCGLVEATVEGHAAYLDSWLQVLRGDRSAIFTAARHAGEAFEFIRAQEMPMLEDMAARSGPDDARAGNAARRRRVCLPRSR